MNQTSITAYLGVLTPHVTQWLDRLAERPDVGEVTLFCDEPTSAERIGLGWPAALGTDGTRTVIGATASEVADHVRVSGPESVHVFIGMRRQICIEAGIAACIRLGRRFGIMHEPRASEGLKGKLRWLHSWLTEGRLRRRAGFILAIGAHGPAWFRGTGYREKRIFPFAYFIEPGPLLPARHRGDEALRIGYVGRLEPVKGVTDVLKAVRRITTRMKLEIAGSGSAKVLCDGQAAIDPRIRSLGVLPWTQVQNHMAGLDVVIQPSRTTDDGWGVVVSEALMNGASVIASSVVGASCCLADPWRGRVVPPASPEAIAEAVVDLDVPEQTGPEARERRMAWSRERLSAEAGADYMMKIIRHVYADEPRPASFLA